MYPFTELEVRGAVFNLNGLVLTSGDVSRTFAKTHWSLRDCRALFLAAWKSGGCPEATSRAASTVVTADTLAAVRAGLIEAAESAIEAMLSSQRYVM